MSLDKEKCYLAILASACARLWVGRADARITTAPVGGKVAAVAGLCGGLPLVFAFRNAG